MTQIRPIYATVWAISRLINRIRAHFYWQVYWYRWCIQPILQCGAWCCRIFTNRHSIDVLEALCCMLLCPLGTSCREPYRSQTREWTYQLKVWVIVWKFFLCSMECRLWIGLLVMGLNNLAGAHRINLQKNNQNVPFSVKQHRLHGIAIIIDLNRISNRNILSKPQREPLSSPSWIFRAVGLSEPEDSA